MKKKIIIGVVAVIVVAAIGLFWLNNRNRSLSPPAKAELTSGDLTLTIPYSRPSVRGRMIFGTKEQGALQPYGVYWRLGANESTEITINRDVMFNDQPVKAGTYKIYTIPGPDSFEIRLNSKLGAWGYAEADYSMDVTKTTVPVKRLSTPVEQFTIRMDPMDNGISVTFEFSDYQFTLPVTVP